MYLTRQVLDSDILRTLGRTESLGEVDVNVEGEEQLRVVEADRDLKEASIN